MAIVTTDNPRDEDPALIARAVAAGCRRGGRAHVQVEADRRRAIARALEQAASGDVIVVAGKGHEVEQAIGSAHGKFSDRAVVLDLIGARDEQA